MFLRINQFASVVALSSALVFTGAAPTQRVSGQSATPAGSASVTKTVWARGLRAPQGMARDAAGNVYVAEYKGGRIARFAPDGKPLESVGSDLKGPAWIERAGDRLYVSERGANRLLMLQNGKLTPLPHAIEQPLGLAFDARGRLLVVSHTTSRLFALQPGVEIPPFNPAPQDLMNLPPVGQRLVPLYAAPAVAGKRYGYRCVAADRDGTILMTDEVEGQLLLLTPGGRAAVWVKGLQDPTTVVLSPRGEVFVAEEGAGRITRIDAHGASSVVAAGLGKPRDIEFVDERTMLVSDQEGGVIWKVLLPPVAPNPAAPR